jgi:hypothetical protein
MEGADKIWSLKSRLEISLDHITNIRTDTTVVNQWYHGLKMPGTSIPHVLTAGTFYRDGKKVFWDIHHPKKAVVISLRDESYDEFIIEVVNPEVLVTELKHSIKLGN